MTSKSGIGWGCLKQGGLEKVNAPYIVYKGAQIRNLFLLLMVKGIMVDEGSKLRNCFNMSIVVTKHSKFRSKTVTV